MTTNPYLKRAAQRGTSGHGRISERKQAKALGAKLTPASGAIRGFKGDMKRQAGDTKFLIEAKSTIHATMSVELGWLVKISEEALAKRSVPALSMTFVTPEGNAKPMGDWVAVPATYFAELLEKLEQS